MTSPDPLAEAVDVWLTRPEEAPEPELLAVARQLLPPSELARGRRFRFGRHRRAFLVTRVLARTVLSAYEDVPPERWRFVAGERGRPEVAPELGSRLQFNLSRTDGLVACAVTRHGALGVDVEASGSRVATMEVAERFFAPPEVRDLRARPPADRPPRFFEYWTLKEAYVKACGVGLSAPLEQFWFDIPPAGPIRVSFGRLADDPAAWQFFQAWATDRHCLAVGVRRTGADLPITVRERAPLPA